MKKWTILTIAFLLLGAVSATAQIFAGQDIIIKQSAGISSKQVKDEIFIPSTNNQIRSIRRTDKGYFIINYNDLKQPVGKPVLYDVIPKDADLKTVEEFAGELIITYTLSTGDFWKRQWFLAVVDHDDLSTIITPSKIFDNNKSNYVEYKISPDKNKLAVIQYGKTDDKYELLVREMFDDLEFEDPYEVSMSIPSEIYDRDFWVTNEGDIFFEGYTYTTEEDYRDRKKIYNRYEIVSDDMVSSLFTIEDVGRYQNRGGHMVKRNGNVVFYGIYLNEDDWIKGVSYAEYDGITGDQIAESFNDLDPYFFSIRVPSNPDAVQRSLYGKSKHRDMTTKIRSCVEKSDGTVAMITESSLVNSWNTDQQSGTKLSLFDVNVICFNEEGQVDWTQKIEKAQYRMEWTSMVRPPYDLDWKKLTHYKLIDDKLHFFFIVNGYGMPELHLTEDSPYDSYYSLHLVHCTVSMVDGQKTVQSLGTIEKKQFFPKFKSFSDFNNGSITFKSFTKKEMRLGVITLE